MAKKLTVEIDADVSKAKRKVREIVDTGGGAATGGGTDVPKARRKVREITTTEGGAVTGGAVTGVDRLSQSMRNAAQRTDEFANKSKVSSEQMIGLTRAFTGFAVGMAATYASRQFGEDSKVGRGLGYTGSVVNGATAGAMAGKFLGPWGIAGGALIGGAAGAYSQYDNYEKADEEKKKAEEEKRAANLESVETWEKTRARTKAFAEELEKLTKCEGDVTAAIKLREQEDARLAQAQREAVGDEKAFAKLSAERQTNARELDALQSLAKQLASKTPESYRAGFGANDALSRIGGDFGTSQNGLTAIERNGKEQLEVMKSIDRKTGVITWQ